MARRDWLIVLTMMVLGAGLLSIRLGWQDYWWDEHVTLMFTRAGWHELMVQHWGTDTHRPLYYGLQKAWNAVFGESTIAVRSLPIALSLLIVPLFYLTARRIAPGPFAAIVVLLLISAPMFVYQGREVRMYALANLAMAAALWCAVVLATRARRQMQDDAKADTSDRWLWAGFAAALALAFYAQALGLFVMTLFGLWILICVGLGILPLRFLWQGLAAFACYIVLILPALYPFFIHATGTVGGSFWVPEPTVRFIYDQTAAAYPYPKWSKPVVALMILWGLWSLRDRPHLAWLMGCMVIGLPLLVLGISFFKPLYLARVIAWGSIVSVLVLAAGLVRLPPVLRWGGVAFLVVSQLMAFQTFLPPAPEHTSEREIAVELQGFDPSRDVLILGYQMLEPALRWHAPQAFEGAAYGFIYADHNRNVIDAAMRSTFVPRAEAEQIALPQTGTLYVVREAELAPSRQVAPEDDVTAALGVVAQGLDVVRSVTAGPLQLDLYDLSSGR
ncbi:MAG: glycosyltransferase family 39 protein [Pseudomonadota bacterium]